MLHPRFIELAKILRWQRPRGGGGQASSSPVVTLGDKIRRGRQIAYEAEVRHAGHHNDDRDALRHAEWSRQMADELGPAFAIGAGAQHELEGFIPWDRDGWRAPQPLSEALMDMRNNSEGISAAVQQRPIDRANLQVSPMRRPLGIRRLARHIGPDSRRPSIGSGQCFLYVLNLRTLTMAKAGGCS